MVGPIMLQECIMQKNISASAGSKTLENFISPFDAAAVTRLAVAGIGVSGRVGMDEFGIGKVSDDRDGQIPGAVEAVRGGRTPAVLCNDFWGTIRGQAPGNGVYYIHPTYGTVSRCGLIPSVSSMDQVGVACVTPRHGFEILSVIAGHDPRDGAMYPDEAYAYAPSSGDIRIGLPDNLPGVDAPEFSSKFKTVSFDLKYFEVYRQVMCILCCAEISGNLSRYDGAKFGYRASEYKGLNDLYVSSRTQGFGLDAKLAAIMGAMVLSGEHYAAYYEKAMKIRRLIKESLDFDKYDVVALPGLSTVQALAPLAGLPSLSLPYKNGAVHLVAAPKNENALYTTWEAII